MKVGFFTKVLLALTITAGTLFADGPKLTVSADRDDCLYELGDSATFTVACDMPDAALDYRLSLDGAKGYGNGTLQLKGGKATLRGAPDQPGVLRLEVTAVAGADTLRESCGCAFSPLAVRATGVLPDDFDRFWGQGKAELLRIPIDTQIEEVAGDEHPSTLYRVSLANIEGSRVYCWYRVPPGQGPFPAVLAIPGAGVRKEGTRENYAENGFAVLTMSVHGISQDREPEYYDQLAQGLLSGYQLFGMDDPYRYFYRRVILGAMRCLDFLESRPEVDKDKLIVAGSSQGGGLSLIVAALDKRIKALTANVPAMCDHSGSLHGRPSGWANLLRRAGGSRSEWVKRTMGYYDAALMASRVEVPALLTAGLVDGTCAPTTVLAAFNNLRGPRWIEIVPAMGHAFPAGYDQRSVDWLRDALDGKISGTKVIRGKK